MSTQSSDLAQKLPSGRDLILHLNQDQEVIEVRSADGMLELRISLTPSGPVVQLRGGRLEIDSTDAVKVNCDKFEVNAKNGIALSAQGPVDIQTRSNVNLEGDFFESQLRGPRGISRRSGEAGKSAGLIRGAF